MVSVTPPILVVMVELLLRMEEAVAVVQLVRLVPVETEVRVQAQTYTQVVRAAAVMAAEVMDHPTRPVLAVLAVPIMVVPALVVEVVAVMAAQEPMAAAAAVLATMAARVVLAAQVLSGIVPTARAAAAVLAQRLSAARVVCTVQVVVVVTTTVQRLQVLATTARRELSSSRMHRAVEALP